MTEVPRAALPVRDDWMSLSEPSPPAETFTPGLVSTLPEPVGRWLLHAIAPGTPLYGRVTLTMRGHIKLGAWRPFTARQILAPPTGFIWAATARVAGLPVSGYDRYSSGTGQMRWRLLGLVPVMSATGPDITRSAAGRLAAETVWVPTAFPRATWHGTVATWTVGGSRHDVELRIDDDGTLHSVLEQRWGNPGGEPFGAHPFGADLAAERTFQGVTIPSEIRAGWWRGTPRQDEGEFFRAEITAAEFT